MKSKKIIMFSLVMLTTALFGCGISKTVRVEGNTGILLQPQQTLAIELESNPTTGYAWNLIATRNDKIIDTIGEKKYASRSKRIGSGGIETYKFKALKAGEAILTFEYKRGWEKVPPAKQYVVRITVR